MPLARSSARRWTAGSRAARASSTASSVGSQPSSAPSRRSASRNTAVFATCSAICRGSTLSVKTERSSVAVIRRWGRRSGWQWWSTAAV